MNITHHKRGVPFDIAMRVGPAQLEAALDMSFSIAQELIAEGMDEAQALDEAAELAMAWIKAGRSDYPTSWAI